MFLRGSWLGTVALGLVLYFGVFSGFNDISVFFNAHAIILVFGGTLAVALLSYSLEMMMDIVDFLVYGFYLKKSNNSSNFAVDLLSVIYQSRQNYKTDHFTTKNGFIREGQKLLKDPYMSADDAYDVLNSIKESFYKKYSEEAKVLLNISKFPPALGLLGASTGMIDMMMNLGTGGTEKIGAAMAVALTATFWGIGAANFVFLPLADYTAKLADDDKYMREIATEAIVMAKEGRDFKVIVEVVSAKLPLVYRAEVITLLNKNLATFPPPNQENNFSGEFENPSHEKTSFVSIPELSVPGEPINDEKTPVDGILSVDMPPVPDDGIENVVAFKKAE